MSEIRSLVIQVPVVANPLTIFEGHLQPVVSYGTPIGLNYDESDGLYTVILNSPSFYISPVDEVFEVRSGDLVISREPRNCRWLKPKMVLRELPETTINEIPSTEINPQHVTLLSESSYETGTYEIASWITIDGLAPAIGETLTIGTEVYEWGGVGININVPTAATLSIAIDNLVNAIKANTAYTIDVWNDVGTLHITGSIPIILLCSNPLEPWVRENITGLLNANIPISGKILTLYIDELDLINIPFPRDMTPNEIADHINAYCVNKHPDYSDVAFLHTAVSGAIQYTRIGLTTATPRYSPRTPRNTQIRVTGSACPYLGFRSNWMVAGDIPSTYNDYSDFTLLYEKRSDSNNKLESFIPVVEENRLLKKAMAEFDANIIVANKRLKLFFDGLAWGMDCAEREADEILNSLDVDNVRPEFLNHVAANLGFSLDALGPLSTETRRDIVRNLIRLYRIKGTELSYESFFRFLSYYAEITERGSDETLGYPFIAIVPENEHVEQYYEDFLQTNQHDDFFNQFDWFYVNIEDIDQRLTERQWWTLQIASGFQITPVDKNGIEVVNPTLLTGTLANWNLHGDYGLMELFIPCTPGLVVNEIVYVDGYKIGRVLQAISPTLYYIYFEDGAIGLPVSGNVTGTVAGGTSIPGQFESIHRNNQLKILVDKRYTWEINFDRYENVYLTSQRRVSAAELEQALQIAAAEQEMPVDIVRIGNAVRIDSRAYGPMAELRILTPHHALGFSYNQFIPTVLSEEPVGLVFSAGTARVMDGTNEIIGELPNDLQTNVTSGDSSFYFHLNDPLTVTSGTVISDTELSSKTLHHVAKLLSVKYLNDNRTFRMDKEKARDRYRVPYITELNDTQYRQLLIFVRYEHRNNPNYWEAAGRPSAGDYTNANRFADQQPWVAPDLNAYPNLGNSIFVRLDVVPFTPRTLTVEDAQRILFLAEFLRPIHVSFDIIFQALNTEDRIIGIPYDPERFLPVGTYPEDYAPVDGNNFGYYWDTTQFGPSLFDPWMFDWMWAESGTAWLFLPAGTLPGWCIPGAIVEPSPYALPGQQPQAEVLNTYATGSWDVVEIADNTWAWPVAGSFNLDTPIGPDVAYTRHFPISNVQGFHPEHTQWQDADLGLRSNYFVLPDNLLDDPVEILLSTPYPYAVTDPAIATAQIKPPYDTIWTVTFTQPIIELDQIDPNTLPAAVDLLKPSPPAGTEEYVFYDGGIGPRPFYRIYDVDPGAAGTRLWVQIFCNATTAPTEIGLTGGYIWDFKEWSKRYVPAPTLFGDIPPWGAGGIYTGIATPLLPHQGIGGASIVSPTWDLATPYDQVYFTNPPIIPDPLINDLSFTFAPNRLATWTYPDWWFRRGPAVDGGIAGLGTVAEQCFSENFLTLSDLTQHRPKWEIAPAGGLDDPFEIGGYWLSSWTTEDGLNPSDNETLTIGDEVYTWKASMSGPLGFNVQIGLNLSDSIDNLVLAITNVTKYSFSAVYNDSSVLRIKGSEFLFLDTSNVLDQWTREFIEDGSVLPNVFVGTTPPAAFLQIIGVDFTPYKNNSRHGWVQGIVEMMDSSDPTLPAGPQWWWAYCMWQGDPYDPSEVPQRVYVFNQMGEPGWQAHPRSAPNTGSFPTTSARFIRVWFGNNIFGEVADRLQFTGEALFNQSGAEPPQDIFHDLPDSMFCGLWPEDGAAANPLTLDGAGREDLPLNRTFGYDQNSITAPGPGLGWVWDNDTASWTWTGGGWQPIHDTDALIVLKQYPDGGPSFVNPGALYTYTNATGIIQYAVPVNLSNVRPGDYFEDGAGVLFTIWGVNDATDQILLRPGYNAGGPWTIVVIGGGDCLMTAWRAFSLTTNLETQLDWNYLTGAVSSLKIWDELEPWEKVSSDSVYYIRGKRIVNTYPVTIVPGVTSLIDSETHGAFFVGSP